MSTNDMIAGGCACGEVRFQIRGAPDRVGLCHCMTCRKAHSSAFNPFVVFNRHQVEIIGTTKAWHSSPGYERRFCPACGSRVVGGTIDSGEVEVSLGSFDEPALIEPQYESWVVRRERWLATLAVPQYEGDQR